MVRAGQGRRIGSYQGLIHVIARTIGPQRRFNHIQNRKQTVPDTEADMTSSHQPGQAAFRSILPEDIDWQPFPAFPPAVRLAGLVGYPSEPGPYVIRVKAPGGTKLM